MSLFLAMLSLTLHCPSQSTALRYCCPIIVQCPRECSHLKKGTVHRSWVTHTEFRQKGGKAKRTSPERHSPGRGRREMHEAAAGGREGTGRREAQGRHHVKKKKFRRGGARGGKDSRGQERSPLRPRQEEDQEEEEEQGWFKSQCPTRTVRGAASRNTPPRFSSKKGPRRAHRCATARAGDQWGSEYLPWPAPQACWQATPERTVREQP